MQAVKRQGQTSGIWKMLCTKYLILIFIDCYFGAIVVAREQMFPIVFQVMWAKVKVNADNVCLFSNDSMFDGYETCYPGWLLRENYPYCFLAHKINVKLLVFISVLSTQYFKNHLLHNCKNLVLWLPLNIGLSLLIFRFWWLRSLSILLFLKHLLINQHFYMLKLQNILEWFVLKSKGSLSRFTYS